MKALQSIRPGFHVIAHCVACLLEIIASAYPETAAQETAALSSGRREVLPVTVKQLTSQRD